MSPGRRRSPILVVIAALLAVLALAAVAWWWLKPQPEALVTTDEPPPPLPYTYEWPDGATRGIDLPSTIYIPSIDRHLPIQFVKDIRSEPGEGQQAFLQRVRLDLVAYSSRQEVEACAEICSAGEDLSVRVTSINSVAYCAVAPVCVDGHVTTNESIHSHCPGRRGLTAQLADQYLSGGMYKSGDALPRCDTEHFSRTDLASPRAGWLAARRHLVYKDVSGKVQRFKGELGRR